MMMMIEAGCIARKFTEGRKEKEGGRVFKYFYFIKYEVYHILFYIMEIARHACVINMFFDVCKCVYLLKNNTKRIITAVLNTFLWCSIPPLSITLLKSAHFERVIVISTCRC